MRKDILVTVKFKRPKTVKGRLFSLCPFCNQENESVKEYYGYNGLIEKCTNCQSRYKVILLDVKD